ncbi:MAG: hypothetical protein AAGG75_01290 [Bacteroidota bacterium]
MNQFIFESKQKTVLLGFIILGVVCLGLSFVMDGTPHHTRFWSNLLHNTVYFTGISFVSLFALAAFTTAYAGWHTVMKRIWEAYSLFLIVGLGFLVIIIAGLWGHMHHLYHWGMDGVADPNSPNYDSILAGKAGFLNKYVYTFGTIIVVSVWYFFAVRLRKLSVAEDTMGGDANFTYHRRIRVFAGIFLPIAAFTSAALIWQWVMSIDAHWYSTLYAWYSTASWFVGSLGLTILTLIYMKSKGYFQNVTEEHMHDLGKYLFAFSVFWTYLWFSQFMLIWYGNNGEETVYYQIRRDEYPVLYFGNLIINFVLPFLILMRNSTKRKFGTLAFVSIICFFGHWWDYFYMIKPGALINAQHADHAAHAAGEHGHQAAEFMMGFSIPGLLELGTFLGFTALFMYFAFHHMSKASLEPVHDPYLGESLHHHV